jgi:hypothetical protein
LISLSTRDVPMMESALVTLLRMVVFKGKHRCMPPFHDESIVPRVAHVLFAMYGGTFKGSPLIAAASCHLLVRVVWDDGACLCGVPAVEFRAAVGPGCLRAVSLSPSRWHVVI